MARVNYKYIILYILVYFHVEEFFFFQFWTNVTPPSQKKFHSAKGHFRLTPPPIRAPIQSIKFEFFAIFFFFFKIKCLNISVEKIIFPYSMDHHKIGISGENPKQEIWPIATQLIGRGKKEGVRFFSTFRLVFFGPSLSCKNVIN